LFWFWWRLRLRIPFRRTVRVGRSDHPPRRTGDSDRSGDHHEQKLGVETSELGRQSGGAAGSFPFRDAPPDPNQSEERSDNSAERDRPNNSRDEVVGE
jgi:hypothetical protein